ncbi:lipopolysaccharide biosynthesis protein [Chitinophaga sp. 30R24]|uniref:lipopolysaccharide biosynthesis protein n=1 Tax=Chitinophaga sp. 30R24 TaxID=3248838 RepID=UPI003B90FB79
MLTFNVILWTGIHIHQYANILMGVVKQQSIISTVLIYLGFAIGGINTLFLFPHFFTDDQYALTRMFPEIGIVLVPLCTLSMGPTINKFYPYYTSHLEDKKNDMLTWALAVTLVGYLLFVLGTVVFKGVIVRKYSVNAPMLLTYFYQFYPFIFCYAFFSIVENYSWSRHRTVMPNFLKEVGIRLATMLLIVLYLFGVIGFDLFLWLLNLLWGVALVILLIYLRKQGQLYLSFRVSNVTRRLFRSMRTYTASILGATFFTLLAKNVAPLIISSTDGLKQVAYLSIATYLATMIQVPQRSISSIALPVLAQSWIDKNMGKIHEIYQKSSLLQLIAALYIYLGIWLSIDSFFQLLPSSYSVGKYVFFFLGLSKVIDLGTGVNAQLLSTSRLWRFDLYSSVILVILSIPLNYTLIRTFGIMGSGYADFLSMLVFNCIRCVFIWKKFGLQPFTRQTLKAIVIAVVAYGVGLLPPHTGNALLDIVIRSIVFSGVFIGGILAFKVSEDIDSTARAMVQRIRRKR